MKSLRNSSNQAAKKILKLKPLNRLNYSSLETGCDLCLQSLRYKLTEKVFKEDEAQQTKFNFESKYFQKT